MGIKPNDFINKNIDANSRMKTDDIINNPNRSYQSPDKLYEDRTHTKLHETKRTTKPGKGECCSNCKYRHNCTEPKDTIWCDRYRRDTDVKL